MSKEEYIQIDYILGKVGNLKEIEDCKVIPGETVERQHRLMVVKMVFRVIKRREIVTQFRIKWWRLNDQQVFATF